MGKVVCTYCGSSWNIQDDHVIAQSKGGVTTVPACSRCNQSKSDKALGAWLEDLKKSDPYRFKRITDHNKRKRSKIAKMVQKSRDKDY